MVRAERTEPSAGPLQCGVLRDCTGCTATKQALLAPGGREQLAVNRNKKG